jgi:hypothetical protein
MMAVLSGSVRISVPSPDGKEIVLAILQAQEVFGEMALLDGKERTADARAMAACTLAVLERRDVSMGREISPLLGFQNSPFGGAVISRWRDRCLRSWAAGRGAWVAG